MEELDEEFWEFEIPLGSFAVHGGGRNDFASEEALNILLPHQRKYLKAAISFPGYARGKCLALPTGFGKTYLAAAIAKHYSKKGMIPVVITKNAIKPNFKHVFGECGLGYVNLLSYTDADFTTRLRKISDKYNGVVFLFDEAHNLLRKKNELLGSIRQCVATHLVFLFTATPVATGWHDLALLTLCWKDDYLLRNYTLIPTTREGFEYYYGKENIDTSKLMNILKPILLGCDEAGKAPKKGEVKYLSCTMPQLEYNLHVYKLHKDGCPTSVTVTQHAAVLAELDNSKFDKINLLVPDLKGVVLLFTNFIKVIEPHLTKLEHSYERLGRDLSQSSIDSILEKANHDNNKHGDKIKIIVLGPGMAEGISFRHVRTVIFLAPPEKQLIFDQVIGRALRQFSLKYLPEPERIVIPIILIAVGENSERKTLEQYRNSLFADNRVKLEEIYFMLKKLAPK